MKKVVIIGGGFAGSYAAKKLEKEFDVVLIDTKNYFEFTPGILRTIVEPEHIRKIQVSHMHYLRRAKIIVGRVKEITKKYVYVKDKKIKFDYLVICSGSSYNTPFKEQNIVNVARAQNLRNCYHDLCKAKKILIIGGGLVGVELAGEIFWKYGKEKKITIVHSKEKLIERNSGKAIGYAKNYLNKMGAEIIYNESIVGKKRGRYFTDKKRKIEADVSFLCTGIIPNFDFMKKNFSNCLNIRNQIKVNEFLQLHKENNIFVAGDINDVSVEKTAQNAEMQAKVAVKNIFALEENNELMKFKPKKTPLIISLGKNKGIYSGRKITFCGFVPGIMKLIVEKLEMLEKRKFS